MIRVLSIILCAWFLVMGVPKLAGSPEWIVLFDAWGYPRVLLLIVGAVESICGVLLLFRKTAVVASIPLGIVMLGAGFTHAMNSEGLDLFKPTLTLLALVWLIMKRRPAPKKAKPE